MQVDAKPTCRGFGPIGQRRRASSLDRLADGGEFRAILWPRQFPAPARLPQRFGCAQRRPLGERAQERAGLPLAVSVVTGPRVVVQLGHHTRSQRVRPGLMNDLEIRKLTLEFGFRCLGNPRTGKLKHRELLQLAEPVQSSVRYARIDKHQIL